MFIAYFLHYLTIALSLAFNSFGVGIAEGLVGLAAIDAINKQPHAIDAIRRTALIGMALIETTAIIGILTVIMLVLKTPEHDAMWYPSLTCIGIIAAICISGFVISLISASPAQAACKAIARQPFLSQKILTFMIMTLAIIQTPIIINFVLMMIMYNNALQSICLAESLRLIASGISVGVSCIGPVIGMSIFAKTACTSIGKNPRAYNDIFSFTLISQAIIETPVIFGILVGVVQLFVVPVLTEGELIRGLALIAASIAIGLGTFGTGISSGKTAAAACTQLEQNPKQTKQVSRTSLIAQGLIETTAIYSILLALILTFLF
jgi:F-type H+-transporting ATPase subunit c